VSEKKESKVPKETKTKTNTSKSPNIPISAKTQTPRKEKINKVESKVILKNHPKASPTKPLHSPNTFSLVNLLPYKYGNFNAQSSTLANTIPTESSQKIDAELKEFQENSNKLKDLVQSYATTRKNVNVSTSSLNKVRTVLLSWLKGENDMDNLEYSSFITEKKIRYLLKNKEKMENRIKTLEQEIQNIKSRINELKVLLTDIYVHYDFADLKKDIESFESSHEIKNKLSTRMMEKLDEMKKMLPMVKEYTNLKEQEEVKTNEKAEIIKILKGSIQTLNFLSNYYKNLKKKSNDGTNKNGSDPSENNEDIPQQDKENNVKFDNNFSTFRNDKKFRPQESKDNRPKSANIKK